jgi:MFS-type transporter involved in bile tolerance (Atg22 family)
MKQQHEHEARSDLGAADLIDEHEGPREQQACSRKIHASEKNRTDRTADAQPTTSLETEPFDTSQLPRFYPRWRGKPWFCGNAEALGWALDAIGRAVAFISAGAFLSTAMLRLAKTDAGCAVDPPDGSDEIPECYGRVYGIRPSSLLTIYTMVVGVSSSALMPFMGAIVDYTPHRLLFGRWLSIMFCLLLLPLVFLSQNNWFYMANVLVILSLVGWAQTMVTYAYLPELTDQEERLSTFTRSFTVASFGSMVLFLASIVSIATLGGFSNNELAVARVGLSTAFVLSSLTLYLAWFRLLQSRPSARSLPPEKSIWTAGFIQVYRTSIHICKNLPTLKYFYLSVAFVDAGVNSLATIALTYVTDTLDFNTTESGFAILAMLLGTVPGAYLAGVTMKRLDPIRSSILATILITINTILAAIVLKGPGQQVETGVLAVVWGTATGWKWTTDRILASVLIPTGQDAELMGVYLFSGQILTWLPPLIFTALNEAGISQRIGIGTLAIWFLTGIVFLICIGSYQDAVVKAGRGHLLANGMLITTSAT